MLTSYTLIVRYLIIKNKTSNIVENSTSKFRKLNLTTMVQLTIILIYPVLFLRCLYQLTLITVAVHV